MAFGSTRPSTGFASHRSLRRGAYHTWSGTAFVVEALILLAFLVAALAILLTLFSDAHLRAEDTLRLEAAVTVASDEAEAFGANPFAVPAEQEVTYQDQTCVVRIASDTSVYAGGVLYGATISVVFQEEELYTLHTSRYVRGGASTMKLLAQGSPDSTSYTAFKNLIAAGQIDEQGNVLVPDTDIEGTSDATTDIPADASITTMWDVPVSSDRSQAGGVA